jgi:transcription initiation factor TFIIF subunit beta
MSQANLETPEKTAIAGRIKHELVCTPVPNIETDSILQQRAIDAMKPKAQTTILSSLPFGPNGIIHAGTQRAHEAFEGFIVRTYNALGLMM